MAIKKKSKAMLIKHHVTLMKNNTDLASISHTDLEELHIS